MASLYCLCLALCILQAAPFGEARPDFGTSLTFEASNAVSALATDIGTQILLIDDELDFTPEQLAGLADDYLPFLKALAAQIVEAVASLANKLATGALSTTGKNALFNDLNNQFNNISAAYAGIVGSWPSSLDGLLGRQLYEALDLAFQALVGVRDVLERLYHQLHHGTSEEEFDNTVLPLLEQALELFRARITLLVYVFQRGGSNIHEASDFYDSYRNHVNDISGEFATASENYAEDLTAGRLTIENEFEPVANAYYQENRELDDGLVGPITNVQSYPGLTAALNKFRSDGPAALTALIVTDLPNAGGSHLNSVALGIYGVFDEIGGYPIEQTLADYLVRSDENAELCFERVEAAACEVPLQAPIRVRECLDRERPRLCRMQELASHLASLQIADIQDIWENLEPCTRLRHRSQRKRCVKHLTTIYDALATAHVNKYEDFMELIQQTLGSSAIRINICLANVDFYSFGTVVPRLLQDLSSCTGCVGRSCSPPEAESTESASNESAVA